MFHCQLWSSHLTWAKSVAQEVVEGTPVRSLTYIMLILRLFLSVEGGTYASKGSLWSQLEPTGRIPQVCLPSETPGCLCHPTSGPLHQSWGSVHSLLNKPSPIPCCIWPWYTVFVLAASCMADSGSYLMLQQLSTEHAKSTIIKSCWFLSSKFPLSAKQEVCISLTLALAVLQLKSVAISITFIS